MTRLFSLAVVSLFLFSPLGAVAQGPGRGPGPWEKGCVPVEALGLSDEQRGALKQIDELYLARILRLRDDLVGKRLELQNLIKDPKVEEQTIRDKAQEMANLHNELQDKMIGYQIRVRAILTSQQLGRWCTLVGPPFMKGWGGGPWPAQ